MKFVQFINQEQQQDWGLIFPSKQGVVYSLAPCCQVGGDLPARYEAIFGWVMAQSQESLQETVTGKSQGIPLEQVTLLAGIPRPIHDVICVGLNYQDHIAECDRGLKTDASEEPTFFSKRASKIYTHGETLPTVVQVDEKLDYEVELAVIIGKKGRDIPADQVESYIFGNSVFNDFSARTIQKSTSQWVRGKGLDGLSAMGQEIVLAKGMEFPPKRAITSRVNGELRQNSMTDAVRHDLCYIISQYSQGTTLEPGDIFITGTPAGVAMGMDQSVYLKTGDVVRCEIEGIAVLENVIG